MKKLQLKSRAMSLLALLSLMSFSMTATFANEETNESATPLNGVGTMEIPYEISTCEDLLKINDNPTSDYVLTQDIDCSETFHWNDSRGFEPLPVLHGYLDGRNFAILDLTIGYTDDGNSGLFNTIHGHVRNLRFYNAEVINLDNNQSSHNHAGVLAASNFGTIHNVYSAGATISSHGTVGGLISVNLGTISKTAAYTTFTDTGSQDSFYGGLVGINHDVIVNSLADMRADFEITDSPICGSLVGILAGGSIDRSYGTGAFKCPADHATTGGLVGNVGNDEDRTPTITNSFVSAFPQHNQLFDGAIAGWNPEQIDLSTNYFDANTLGISYCDPQGTPCNAVDTIENPNYFFNSSNAPLDTWDFENTWLEFADRMPELRLDDPLPHTSPILTAFNVTASDVFISWEPPKSSTGGDVDVYEIIYKEYSDDLSYSVFYDSSWEVFTTVDGETTSLTLDNIDNHKSYLFRVRAVNEGGYSLPSYPGQVQGVPPAITGFSVSNVTSKSALLSWDDISDVASSYQIEFRNTSEEHWHTTSSKYFPAASQEFYPLEENTEYEFRIAGVSSRGIGEFSSTLQFKTTPQQNYTISSCEELQNINNDRHGIYELTKDIDCSDTENWNEGLGFDPIANPFTGTPFTGTLDGKGHSIIGLTVKRTGAFNGLFAAIDGATIKNLNLVGGSISNEANTEGVYTDLQITIGSGAIAGIASSVEIENITSSMNIRGNNIEGFSAVAGGLVGHMVPSHFGIGAQESSSSINNVKVTGSITGMLSGSIIGASSVVDVPSLAMNEPRGIEDAIPYIGSKLNVDLRNSDTNTHLRCVIVCSGAVGANIANLNIDNVTASGTTGVINMSLPDFPTNFDSVLTSMYMLGPVSAGLVGGNLPLSTNGSPSQLTITNSQVDSTLEGTITAGVIGLNLPSITIDTQAILEIGIEGELADLLETLIASIPQSKSLVVDNVNINSDITCVFLCSGVMGANLGDALIQNVQVNGTIGSLNVDNERTELPLDSLLTTLVASGPITAGITGISLPVSITNEQATLNIKNVAVNGDLEGTVTSGGVAVNLLSIKVPVAKAVNFALNIDPETGPNPELMIDLILSALHGVLTTQSLDVDKFTLNGDLDCAVLCGGATGLSLGNSKFNNININGDITNNNAPLINANHPVSMCPIQITGGIVGTQVLLNTQITNSKVNGNITVNQDGISPDTSLIEFVTSMMAQEGEESTPLLISLICNLGATLQGTGGAIGSYLSPIDISGVANTIFQSPGAVPSFEAKIENVRNIGSVATNASSATGGLAGLLFGKANIINSSSSGNVSSSAFAELFRTPIASASTGGLIGRAQGTFEVSGDLLTVIFAIIELSNQEETAGEEIIETYKHLSIQPSYITVVDSYASGHVYSSNSAGGLIGNAASNTRILRSFALGDVYGTSSGGLIGSGLNLGSLLSVLNLFGTIELDNTYARGNVYVIDDKDTVTFAGGLVGSMIHLGEFRINNSYSTGIIGVQNNATDTRLVAGGLVGAALDLGFVPDLGFLLTQLDPDAHMISGLVKESLNNFGLEIRQGINITNSFTTSQVPANSTGVDKMLQDIATGNPSAFVTSGSLIGFLFSIDLDTIPSSLEEVFGDIAPASDSGEGEEPNDGESGEDESVEGEGNEEGDQGNSITPEQVFTLVGGIKWNDTEQVVANTYYDSSANKANVCGTTLPGVTSIALDLMNSIDPDNPPESPLEYLQFLPSTAPTAGINCSSVSQSNYFKGTTKVAPLSSWDFNTVWHAHNNDFPTFVANSVIEKPIDTGGTGNDHTNTPNPNPRPSDPFIPTILNPGDIIDFIEETIGSIKPPSEVLPELSENIQEELEGKVQDAKKKDKSLLSTILGLMSATGMFLLRNLAIVALLVILGASLWLYGRKKKVVEAAEKSSISKGFS